MIFVVALIVVVLGMLITAVVIAAWAIAAAYRWVAAVVNGVRPERPWVAADVGPRCLNASCRSANPAHAQFCRRCGAAMTATAFRSAGPMRYPIPDPQRVAV